MKLTEAMKAVVAEQRLGFVASVNPGGTPNLSPKGTFVVLDDEHLAFVDLRSPNTTRNIAAGSAVEINFVDPFSRKGFRFFGHAAVLAPDSDGFAAAMAASPALRRTEGRARAIISVRIERAAPLISPAYDTGATETELRRNWAAHFRSLQPGGRFPD
jgi:predicted pyridoxine 5'-phosphate oxidase superfamily flavin-nucleotide-binding protein